MRKHETSWPNLWKKATETVRSRQSSSAPEIAEPSPALVKVYHDALGRKPGDPGFIPPPPPPRPKPTPPAAPALNSVASATSNDAAPAPPKKSFLEEVLKFRPENLKPVDAREEPEAKPPSEMEASFAQQLDKSFNAILSLRSFIDPGYFDGDDSDSEFD